MSDGLAAWWALQMSFEDGLERAACFRAQATEGVYPPEIPEDAERHFAKIRDRLYRVTTPVLAVRHAFEFAVPVGLGVYAFVSLLAAR